MIEDEINVDDRRLHDRTVLIAALVVIDTAIRAATDTTMTDEVGAPTAMTIDKTDDNNHDHDSPHDSFVTIAKSQATFGGIVGKG